jgi:hypothetical protein
MSDLNAVIHERWGATEALVALVPQARSVPGKYGAYAQKYDEQKQRIDFPIVLRTVQFEQREKYTSDKKIFRTTVVFEIHSTEPADGQAVRRAFWGRAGIDGFENQTFETDAIVVLKAREEDWDADEDDDGLWTWRMVVEFVWYYKPEVPPVVITTGTLMYSQSSQVPASAVAATSLVGTGPGSLIVAADSQSVGDKFVICFSGYYSTGPSLPGRVRFAALWGAKTLRTPWLNLLADRDEACFHGWFEFTRQSLGLFGQYAANGIVFVEDATPEALQVRTFGVDTLSTLSDAEFDVTLELDTSGNNFACGQLDVEKKTLISS